MKRIILSTALFLGISSLVKAQNYHEELTTLASEISSLKTEQEELNEKIILLSDKNAKADLRITTLESAKKILEETNQTLELANKELSLRIDSLQNRYDCLSNSQKADKTELSTIIGKTNEKVLANENLISSRTLWGICGIILLLIAIIGVIWAFAKRFKSGSTSIDEVKKAQNSLEIAQENMRKAQEKMQEESIQLDNKLIELLSNQTIAAPQSSENGEIDHSLTLKVADEIIKIEMNLSRMDESIKGYKQLAKGVQRIKDNFAANDYEIVDMLGKPYKAGMKAAVTFVTDDTLEPGQQIITRIIKPQVNYKQIMIQAAQIEVSQAE